MSRPRALKTALLRWQASSGRTLEARAATSPWDVLVVEVMSQQTQIERVGRRWRSFVERWPDPAALSRAGTHDLLAEWAGLGYNRRALALRETARRIVRDHDGAVPEDLDALVALPGIGPYTARAILATAFGRPVAPVDVNVRRVVTRMHGGKVATGRIQAAADSMVTRRDPKRWVWAVMDLAATVCSRRAPRCSECPIREACASAGTVGEEPIAGAGTSFESTNRWLRGQVLARLRAAGPGAWIPFAGPIGTHGTTAVSTALTALEAEGFLEREGMLARLV